LRPSSTQKRILDQWAGCARFTYNKTSKLQNLKITKPLQSQSHAKKASQMAVLLAKTTSQVHNTSVCSNTRGCVHGGKLGMLQTPSNVLQNYKITKPLQSQSHAKKASQMAVLLAKTKSTIVHNSPQ
jgi:hypothetical protein